MTHEPGVVYRTRVLKVRGQTGVFIPVMNVVTVLHYGASGNPVLNRTTVTLRDGHDITFSDPNKAVYAKLMDGVHSGR